MNPAPRDADQRNSLWTGLKSLYLNISQDSGIGTPQIFFWEILVKSVGLAGGPEVTSYTHHPAFGGFEQLSTSLILAFLTTPLC